MALMGCVGSRANEALLQAVDEAVKENAHARLKVILQGHPGLPAEALNYKNLLHQAAWLGYPHCVHLLIQHGADPDLSHRKNGCTPLHLAHFCTIDDTNPGKTIQALIDAGANVNNPGSHKCGKVPLDHAIQHQRLDSVQVLLGAGAKVALQSVLIAIDVANPHILELLLGAGGQCGRILETTMYWGQPLHRVLYTPLKCPRECYKQMFRLFVQATVCQPNLDSDPETEVVKPASNTPLMIETELRTMARDYVDLTQYLYAFLLRNGFYPNDSIKTFMNSHGEIHWVGSYLSNPATLRDLCVRVARTNLYHSGNIIYGVNKLDVPTRLKNLILLSNPL